MSLFMKQIKSIADIQFVINELDPTMDAHVLGDARGGYMFIDTDENFVTFDTDADIFGGEKPLISLDGEYNDEEADWYQHIENYSIKKAKQIYKNETKSMKMKVLKE